MTDWMAVAKARFTEKHQNTTPKTPERVVSVVSVVPSGRESDERDDLSVVSVVHFSGDHEKRTDSKERQNTTPETVKSPFSVVSVVGSEDVSKNYMAGIHTCGECKHHSAGYCRNALQAGVSVIRKTTQLGDLGRMEHRCSGFAQQQPNSLTYEVNQP